MIHHCLTKYYDEQKAKYIAESWIQIDILGFSWCISKKIIQISFNSSIFSTRSLASEISKREGVDYQLIPNETSSRFEVDGEATVLVIYD